MKTQVSYTYSKTLGDIINGRPILTFKTEDALPDILSSLHNQQKNVAAVVDVSGHLAGMITKNNILRRVFPKLKKWPADLNQLHKHKAIRGVIVWDVMIPQPDSLHVNDAIEDALDVMTYLSHQYMPVVDSEKRLVGIVGYDDLRDAVEKKYGALKSIEDPISLYMVQQKLHDTNLVHAQAY